MTTSKQQLENLKELDKAFTEGAFLSYTQYLKYNRYKWHQSIGGFAAHQRIGGLVGFQDTQSLDRLFGNGFTDAMHQENDFHTVKEALHKFISAQYVDQLRTFVNSLA